MVAGDVPYQPRVVIYAWMQSCKQCSCNLPGEKPTTKAYKVHLCRSCKSCSFYREDWGLCAKLDATPMLDACCTRLSEDCKQQLSAEYNRQAVEASYL